MASLEGPRAGCCPLRDIGLAPTQPSSRPRPSRALWRPRLLVGLVLGVAAVALLALATAAPAYDARVSNARILRAALRDDGRDVHMQCKKWVNTLFTKEARAVGSSARLGGAYGDEDYLDHANGARISAADVEPGDIIQVADFSDPEGGAPLHTAIVLQDYADGRYLVIDANYVAEETVGTHVWDPFEYAGDEADVRFYRIGRPCSSDPRVPRGDLIAAGVDGRVPAAEPLTLSAVFADDVAVTGVRFRLLVDDHVAEVGTDMHKSASGIWSVTWRAPEAGHRLRVQAIALDAAGHAGVAGGEEYRVVAPFAAR